MKTELGAIKGMLVQRLQDKGVESCLLPGLLKQMAGVLSRDPYMTRVAVNCRLQFLGWDIELDEHTYQMALACFEAEDIDPLKHRPANWFSVCFPINECVS